MERSGLETWGMSCDLTVFFLKNLLKLFSDLLK